MVSTPKGPGTVGRELGPGKCQTWVSTYDGMTSYRHQCKNKQKYGDKCGTHTKDEDRSPAPIEFVYKVARGWRTKGVPRVAAMAVAKVTAKQIWFKKDQPDGAVFDFASRIAREEAYLTPEAAAQAFYLQRRRRVVDAQKELDDEQRALVAAEKLVEEYS